MSTRSNIALESLDGTIRAIYCHSDGYPEGVGAMLAEHYRTPEQIKNLLALGNRSCLYEDPTTHVYGGETERAFDYANRADYTNNNRHCDLEFLYLYSNGVWLVYDIYHNPQWRRLSDVIEIDEPEPEPADDTAEDVKKTLEEVKRALKSAEIMRAFLLDVEKIIVKYASDLADV